MRKTLYLVICKKPMFFCCNQVAAVKHSMLLNDEDHQNTRIQLSVTTTIHRNLNLAGNGSPSVRSISFDPSHIVSVTLNGAETLHKGSFS